MKRLFIVNPDSQTVKIKGSVLGRVKTSSNTDIELLDDFSVLPEIAARAAKNKVSHVFIEGGDGTAHGVLTAFLGGQHAFDSFPNFTLLAGGMTNQVARNIGIKHPTVQKITALIETCPARAHHMPLLDISTGHSAHKFGFLFSTGGIPSATDYCKETMHGRGIGGSVAVAATIMHGVAGSKAARDNMMPPTPVSLRITNEKNEIHIDEMHLGTVVTTLPGLIMGLDPFWGDGRGALRATYVRADAKKLVRNLAGLWAGRKHVNRSGDGIESFNAHALHYDYQGPCVLDGEKVDSLHGQIDVRPTEPVTFLT